MSPGGRCSCRCRGLPRHSSRSRRTASMTIPIFSIAFTAPPSRQCGCAISAWPGRPVTVNVGVSDPRQATHTSNAVGSGTMPASARTPWRTAARPPAPDDSSSVIVFTIRSPLQPHPEPVQHLGREHHAGHAALHVAGAAPVQVAVAHLGPVRVARPAVARLRRDDVDVAVQEQAAAAARPGEPGGQLRAPVEAESRRHLARAGDVGGGRLPDVHGGAGRGQALPEIGLQVGLLAGRVARRAGGRVEPDQPRRQLDQLFPTGGDRIQDACLQRHGGR